MYIECLSEDRATLSNGVSYRCEEKVVREEAGASECRGSTSGNRSLDKSRETVGEGRCVI